MGQIEPAKAVLIPMNGHEPDADQSTHITVQFNPESLRVSLSNTLKADNSGGHSSSAAQYVDKSESTLSVELVFDTTVQQPEDVPANHTDPHADGGNAAGSNRSGGQSDQSQSNKKAYKDVRLQTRRIAETFMKPVNPDSHKPGAPKRCHFQWGSFAFTGMVSSYSETLDFFSADGVPLRCTLSLTLKQDRYQYDGQQIDADSRHGLPAAVAPPEPHADDSNSRDQGASQANQLADRPSDQWRDTAMHNGMENPRRSGPDGVVVERSSRAGGGAAPQNGRSSTVGAGVPGAFPPRSQRRTATEVRASRRTPASWPEQE